MIRRKREAWLVSRPESWLLRVLLGAYKISLDAEEGTTIGLGRHNRLRIGHLFEGWRTIRPNHAYLRRVRNTNTWVVENLTGEKEQVAVNGLHVPDFTELQDGAVLQLGELELTFRQVGQ